MKKKSSVISLQGLVDGDSGVVQEIYKSIYPKVLQFIGKNNGSEEDAQEVFQETLFQIITRAKVKGLEIESNFGGYIFICSRNIWYNKLNKSKKTVRNDTVLTLIKEEDTTVENILYQERWDLFEEKINELSENCKSLLKDYFKKISYDTIIEKYGYTSKNVAFQRIHKCKKGLEKLIKVDKRYKEL